MKKTIEDIVLESHPNMILRKKPSKQPTRVYSFRIFEDLLEEAKSFSLKERISVSQVINKALLVYLAGKISEGK